MRALLLAVLAAAGFAFAKRQKEAGKDAALWREATNGSAK